MQNGLLMAFPTSPNMSHHLPWQLPDSRTFVSSLLFFPPVTPHVVISKPRQLSLQDIPEPTVHLPGAAATSLRDSTALPSLCATPVPTRCALFTPQQLEGSCLSSACSPPRSPRGPDDLPFAPRPRPPYLLLSPSVTLLLPASQAVHLAPLQGTWLTLSFSRNVFPTHLHGPFTDIPQIFV